MKCPKCEKENSDSAQFCDQCGTSLTAQTCPNCEHENSSVAAFCEKCGKPLKADPPPVEAPPSAESKPIQTACPACGQLNAQGSNFCQSCGYAFTSTQQQPIQPTKVRAKKSGGLHPLLAFLYGILGTAAVLALLYIALTLSLAF